MDLHKNIISMKGRWYVQVKLICKYRSMKCNLLRLYTKSSRIKKSNFPCERKKCKPHMVSRIPDPTPLSVSVS